ncbi:MAG: glycoside hydrolase domain-containing protein [Candidatus Acidiferrales bacterium]
MNRFSRFRALILFVLVLFFANARADARPAVWVVPALSRIGREDAAQDVRRIVLWAGRGEYESFQVIVRGPRGELTGMGVSASDLAGPSRRIISRTNVQIYREQYVHIEQGSPDPGGSNRPLGPGWYADALIPVPDEGGGPTRTPDGKDRGEEWGAPLRGEDEINQPFWVDVFVPRTAKPGEYHGSVRVTSSDGAISVQVTLHVWNFELPLRPSLRSAFWIFNEPADGSTGRPAISYSSQPENQRLLLEHKIMPLTVQAAWEREFIDRFGLNISLLKWFDTASYGHCSQPAAPSVADLSSFKRVHQPDLPLFVYLGDEVTECQNIFPALKTWSANVRRAGLIPMLTAVPVSGLRDDGLGDGRGVADIWVLLPKQFVSDAADVGAARNEGAQFWAYTAAVQDSYSPKWAIDFSPANYRIFGGFLAETQGVSGILYWAVNSWAIHAVPDPWNNLVYKEPSKGIPPGDGWLVYPDGANGFVPSMRLKWIRKSVEDYEYVEMLKRAGRGEWALQVARTVATDWAHWSQDPEAIENARRQLGEELNRLASRPVATEIPTSTP